MIEQERQEYIQKQINRFSEIQRSHKKSFGKRIKDSLTFHKYARHLVENQPTVWINPNNPPLNLNNKRIAVYTCVTGGYDVIKNPAVIPNNVDFYIYTESEFDKNIWKELKVNPEHIQGLSKAEVNRYIKHHPFELFPDYDYVIYIDGSVFIIDDITSLLNNIDKEMGFATYSHPSRNCVFDEVYSILALGKGNKKNIESQIKRFKEEGMPTHFGLLECTVLAFDIKNQTAKKICDGWWNEFITSKSGRDQLALPYVVWKMGLNPQRIGTLGQNVLKDSRFIVFNLH